MLSLPTNTVPAPQHAISSQPIDITLEEVGRPPMGGTFCQVKGRVTFQHQSLIPDGFPKRWTFKTSPPIVYLREILFAQSEPNQYGNPGIQDRGLIYGTMQVCSLLMYSAGVLSLLFTKRPKVFEHTIFFSINLVYI